MKIEMTIESISGLPVTRTAACALLRHQVNTRTHDLVSVRGTAAGYDLRGGMHSRVRLLVERYALVNILLQTLRTVLSTDTLLNHQLLLRISQRFELQVDKVRLKQL